jgi:hypothetical protein
MTMFGAPEARDEIAGAGRAPPRRKRHRVGCDRWAGIRLQRGKDIGAPREQTDIAARAA